MTTLKVYEAICNITSDLSKIGISKDRKNEQQGYRFRGIDDVYSALSPLLAKYKLCILPRVITSDVIERTSAKGNLLFYTTLRVEFDFVSAEDGSKHTVAMVGEAMDSADKSSNKAQSAAYKYACLQAFCIPTEGDNDADAQTHEAKAKPYVLKAPAAPPQISVKQILWDNLKAHCNQHSGKAGMILKHLTGKQFISDVTEDEAAVAQVKFEADFLGEVRE